MKNILITGASGWTAQAIVQRLKQDGHNLIAFDLPGTECPVTLTPSFDNIIYGNIAHFDDIFQAAQGVDAIIHLAVATGDVYQNADLPFAVNVKGTFHVFEAARRLQIPKIVLTSSAPVHLLPLKNKPFQATDWQSSPDGDHLYDLTKRLQEEITRDFCQTFSMQAVVLRAGHIVDGRAHLDPKGRPLAELHYCRGGWICRHDLAEACLQAIHQNKPGYNAYHIIGSWQARLHFDISCAENELNFKIQTDFREY